MREPLLVLAAAAVVACTERVERVPVESLDRTAPFVLVVAPAPAATGVPRDARVSVTFSEPMEPASLATCLGLEGPDGPIPGTTTASADGLSVTFAPAALLEPLAGYAATLAAGPSDPSGNLATPARWAFRTAAALAADVQPPRIVARTPAPGSLLDPAEARTVSVTFDEPVDCGALPAPALTLLADGVAVSGELTCAGATLALVPPRGALFTGTSLVAVVAPHVRDLAGNAVGAPERWSFAVRPWRRFTASPEYDMAYAAAADARGVVVAGVRSSPAGGFDALVLAYDPDGVPRWERTLGTSAEEQALAVAPEPTGGVVVAGYTSGALPGATYGGRRDGFVASYDAAGALRWLTQTGDGGDDLFQAVAVDAHGNVFVAGKSTRSPYQALGGWVYPTAECYVAKLDPSGVGLWGRGIGADGEDGCAAVDVDAAGTAVVAGYLNPPDGGPSEALVAKFDGNGVLRWYTLLGTPGYDEATAVVAEPSGDVFVAGWTTGALAGPASGGSDAFVARIDPLTRVRWARQLGTGGAAEPRALALDGAGGVVMAGTAGSWLDGGSVEDRSAFAVAFDGDGERRWVRQLPFSSLSGGIASDGAGALYLAGTAMGPDDTPGAGSWDGFVLKLDVDGRWR